MPTHAIHIMVMYHCVKNEAREQREALEIQGRTASPPPPNATFALVTLVIGLDANQEESLLRNKLWWTHNHGVQLCVYHALIDSSRPPSWNKILAVVHMLMCSSDTQWVIHMDADAVVHNQTLSPMEMLSSVSRAAGGDAIFSSKQVVWSTDFGHGTSSVPGIGKSPINASVYIIRNSKASIDILLDVYNTYHGMTPWFRHHWQEQHAIHTFYAKDPSRFKRECIIVSNELFNSHGTSSRESDFIRHFAGMKYFPGSASKYDYISSLLHDREALLPSEQYLQEQENARRCYAVPSRLISSWREVSRGFAASQASMVHLTCDTVTCKNVIDVHR